VTETWHIQEKGVRGPAPENPSQKNRSSGPEKRWRPSPSTASNQRDKAARAAICRKNPRTKKKAIYLRCHSLDSSQRPGSSWRKKGRRLLSSPAGDEQRGPGPAKHLLKAGKRKTGVCTHIEKWTTLNREKDRQDRVRGTRLRVLQ